MTEITCSDAQCEVREHCLRWQRRGATRSDLHHATTLRPTWQCHSDPCDHASMIPEFYQMANLPSPTRCGPTDEFPRACAHWAPGSWEYEAGCFENFTPDHTGCLRHQVQHDEALHEEMTGWPEGLDNTRSCQ